MNGDSEVCKSSAISKYCYSVLLFCRLGVLPLELNRLLIIVVVLSMALTPFLNEMGREAAEYIQREFEDSASTDSVRRPCSHSFNALAQ